MSEERIDFSRRLLVLGNLALLAWVFLAFAAAWFFNQVYGWLLLIFTAAAVYLILRRLGCSSCYYCKSCTSGFGRLAGAFFGTGYLKKGRVGNRHGIVAFVYVLLVPVPVLLATLSMVQAFDVFKVVVFAWLIAISGFSVSTWLQKKTKKNPAPQKTPSA